jgi:acyl CoA:acetate/3-ketoacid CoA transferase
MFIDLPPRVALVCAEQGDYQGNLYTGPNTEDTPVIVEATAFRQGIVIAQVNSVAENLPRVDIPGSWVDLIVVSDRPYAVEPLFTRDPRHISELHVLWSKSDRSAQQTGTGPAIAPGRVDRLSGRSGLVANDPALTAPC